MSVRRLAVLASFASCALVLGLGACNRAEPPASTSTRGDSAFAALSNEILHDYFRRHPRMSTQLGVHAYDSVLDDVRASAFDDEARADSGFRARLLSLDTTRLSLDQQLDRQLLIHAMDFGILSDRTIKPFASNPDFYSSGVTNAAYVIMEREYAPASQRLTALVARENAMPAALMQARANLVNPPRIFTEIAVEQVDGDANFFTQDVPAGFTSVTDTALVRRFTASNAAVIKALAGYKTYLEHDLKLKPADSALARPQREHPAPNALLATTQNVLDSLRQFVIDHHIATIPPSDPAHVIETPPFERSTTVASMDTPGPFETAKVKAYYNVTLPDPRWANAEREAYMRSWYPAMMSNVSVHEVYPGHYVQFLYAKSFPSDVRKVFSANTNVEGLAHYDERMMLDEAFRPATPRIASPNCRTPCCPTRASWSASSCTRTA